MTNLLALLVPVIVVWPTPTHPPVIYSDDVVPRLQTHPPIIYSDDVVVETCPEGFIWHFGCVATSQSDKEELESLGGEREPF